MPYSRSVQERAERAAENATDAPTLYDGVVPLPLPTTRQAGERGPGEEGRYRTNTLPTPNASDDPTSNTPPLPTDTSFRNALMLAERRITAALFCPPHLTRTLKPWR